MATMGTRARRRAARARTPETEPGGGGPDGAAYHLMTVANLIAKNTAQNTLAGSGLNVNEWRLLRFFAGAAPLTATDAAGALGMDKTTVSRTISALEASGFLAFSPNPADRRETRISLTAAGRKVHDRIYPIDRAVDASFESRLTRAESKVLLPILGKLREHALALIESGRR